MFLKNMSYQEYNNNNSIQQEIITSSPDSGIQVVVMFLIVIGIMAIFSASAPKCIASNSNPLHFVIQQVVGFILGLAGMFYFMKKDYKELKKYALPFSLVVIGMLLCVQFTGDVINGAKRWLSIGPLSIQPSEFAKPAVVLLLASVFSRDSKLIDQNKFMYAYLPILIMIFLIYKQPNLSMVMLLLATSGVIYGCAGGSFKNMSIAGLAGIVGIALMKLKAGLAAGVHGYQMNRITAWLHPEEHATDISYNVIQSLVGFASGGIWGVGFGASKQKLAWLPESHTDFIFSIIGEELGFIGCLLVICLFATLMRRGMAVCARCPDMYGKLLALGITFSICCQAFLNMAVTSSLVPATGVPMPFISYGGSSLVVSMWMIGILLNISKTKIKRIRTKSNVRYI